MPLPSEGVRGFTTIKMFSAAENQSHMKTRREIDEGKIPAIMLNGVWMIPEEFAEERRIQRVQQAYENMRTVAAA